MRRVQLADILMETGNTQYRIIGRRHAPAPAAHVHCPHAGMAVGVADFTHGGIIFKRRQAVPDEGQVAAVHMAKPERRTRFGVQPLRHTQQTAHALIGEHGGPFRARVI